ncbi:MAG: hypothetical protein K0R00_2266 [Herbinix sp.]|nr:hypothetical protein [Herbinix sp.]
MKNLKCKLVLVIVMILLIPFALPTYLTEAATKQKVVDLNFKVNEDFILGETKATVSFKLVQPATNVKVFIIDSLGKTIKSYSVGKLKANSKKTLTWDGKASNNTLVEEGYYSVKVIADKTKGVSETLYAKEQVDFAGGNGSKNKPYLVSTKEQLINVGKYNRKYFKQIKDIDFDYTSITPLYSTDLPFNGVYNGGNYKILNLTLTQPNDNYVALFASVGAAGKIQNVVVENCMITGKNFVGGLVGLNSGMLIYCEVNGTITANCKIQDEDVSIGGICGENNGNINSCKSSGNLSANSTEQYSEVRGGGIAGINNGNILNAQSSMDVNCSYTTSYANYNASYAGGIAGKNTGVLNGCISTGIICSKIRGYNDTYAGGITGESSGQVINCQFNGAELTAENVGDILPTK